MTVQDRAKADHPKPVRFTELIPDSERCLACSKTIFYLVIVNDKDYFVHGDKSFCTARTRKR